MGAEGQIEVERETAGGLDLGLDAAEDGDIGGAKFIYGLFRVTHDEEVNFRLWGVAFGDRRDKSLPQFVEVR